jgi:RNA recognition motif. (a.k.a. RRM, RBD, or RNP domain)
MNVHVHTFCLTAPYHNCANIAMYSHFNKYNTQGSGKWVYIKGIPSDCTDDELRDHMSKAGVIATDPVSQAPRLKLYRYVYL